MKKYFKVLVFFVAVILILTISWDNRTFSTGTLNQLIYHTKFTGKGGDSSITYSWLLQVLLPGCTITGAVYWLMPRLLHQISTPKIRYVNTASVSIITLIVFALVDFNVLGYIGTISQSTTIYEQAYVDPQTTSITFTSKRNLVYIYLESVETTYFSSKNGGINEVSLMPGLEQLALDNTNFSNTALLGGWQTLEGTQWTIASMISQNCGIPVISKISDNDYDPGDPYLAGAYSLGQILDDNGYNNVLLKGSDCDFAGTSNFFDCHGNYTIYDYDVAIAEGFIPEDYKVTWGMEDGKTYEYAKEILENVSSKQEPFNFVMETVNTHTPDGYLEEGVPELYDDQYSNVIADASVQVVDFINYLKAQDYYDDTTIVVVGDHLSMFDEYFDGIDANYLRTPVNLIINSAVTTDNTKNRTFSALDMFPTTIAAIGGVIDGDRLGLGTNLYSDQPTLLEKYGFDYVNEELQKSSDFYETNFIGTH